MYYVGLDLHKKHVTGCVLDSQGVVVALRVIERVQASQGAGGCHHRLERV